MDSTRTGVGHFGALSYSSLQTTDRTHPRRHARLKNSCQLCIRLQDASSGQLVAVWRDLGLLDCDTAYGRLEDNWTTEEEFFEAGRLDHDLD